MLRGFGPYGGVFLMLILAFALTGLIGPLGFGLASLTLGLAATALARRVYGDWSADTISIFGYAMLSLTAIFFAVGAKTLGAEGGLVGLALFGGLIISVGGYLLLRMAYTATYPYRAGRDPERRQLAAAHRWRFDPADDAVLDDLRSAARQLAPAPGTPAHLVGAKATAVVRGEANGVPFTAFDYFLPRRLSDPLVVSACVVRLPYSLPPYRPNDGAPCLFCGLVPHVDGRHPPVDDLLAVLGPDWWIGAARLVWQGSGYGPDPAMMTYTRGVPAARLAASIDAATQVAARLDWSALTIRAHPPLV